jgi:hypothetical protein
MNKKIKKTEQMKPNQTKPNKPKTKIKSGTILKDIFVQFQVFSIIGHIFCQKGLN